MSDERPPRRNGRPPLDPNNATTSVHLKLSAPHYDALYAEARRQRVSVHEVIRRTLVAKNNRG